MDLIWIQLIKIICFVKNDIYQDSVGILLSLDLSVYSVKGGVDSKWVQEEDQLYFLQSRLKNDNLIIMCPWYEMYNLFLIVLYCV